MTSLLSRKPDSGLGNIRAAGPAAPSRNVDWVLLAAQGTLSVIGCLIVYSATRNRGIDPFFYATRQVIFTIVATVALAVVMMIDYDWFRNRAGAMYLLTCGSLVALLGLSKVTGRDLITFELGPINVQPAEAAKVTILVATAAYLHEEHSDEVSYPRFIGGLLLIGIPAILILLQPDLGGASVLIAAAMGVLLVAGAKKKYIAAYSGLAVATIVAGLAANLASDYQLQRVRVFFDEENPELAAAAYQVNLANQALGTGGVFGKGWLQGPLTNNADIPVVWADFPMAALGEQFGLVGCATVLGLFAVMMLRIWRIAHLSRDRFGTYVCAGVFAMLAWQVFQNVGMTMKIIPVTGLPLPFISYGGSGQVVWFILLGIVQSIHMRRMR